MTHWEAITIPSNLEDWICEQKDIAPPRKVLEGMPGPEEDVGLWERINIGLKQLKLEKEKLSKKGWSTAPVDELIETALFCKSKLKEERNDFLP